jgi:hypothetical protein
VTIIVKNIQRKRKYFPVISRKNKPVQFGCRKINLIRQIIYGKIIVD